MRKFEYSAKSDVFAFGVLLYEIYSCSEPWPELTNVEAAGNVLHGDRMDLTHLEKSSRVPSEIIELMNRCWEATASKRPRMRDIRKELRALLSSREASKRSSKSKISSTRGKKKSTRQDHAYGTGDAVVPSIDQPRGSETETAPYSRSDGVFSDALSKGSLVSTASATYENGIADGNDDTESMNSAIDSNS